MCKCAEVSTTTTGKHKKLCGIIFSEVKSVHFKKSVTRSSFLSKSVVFFADFVLIPAKMTTLFARNEIRVTDFLKWTDFTKDSVSNGARHNWKCLLKSVHFKKPVTRSSFLSKSVVIFADFVLISAKMTTLFERNENRVTDFLKWTDFKSLKKLWIS